jgi:hypothetical protein
LARCHEWAEEIPPALVSTQQGHPSAILTLIKYVDLQKCYPVKLGEALS